jgi:hypothetical protein
MAQLNAPITPKTDPNHGLCILGLHAQVRQLGPWRSNVIPILQSAAKRRQAADRGLGPSDHAVHHERGFPFARFGFEEIIDSKEMTRP